MKKTVMLAICAAFCLFAVHTTAVAGDQHEVEGVVKQIKSETKKITISHGPIKSLGMDGMTMDFAVYLVIMELEDKGMAQDEMGSGGDHSQHHRDH